MKKRLSTIMLIMVFLLGLSLLLYPTVSDFWNSLHQSRAIGSYVDQVQQLEPDRSEQIKTDAVAYNAALAKTGNDWVLTPEQKERYLQQLDINGSGIMGYIEIPAISCSLPIYHGTADTVLQIAVGHMEGSSLPIGGVSTHCVLSGHRGLPSADLFTDLDKLVLGDVFMLNVLDETLTYEVYEILTVLPHEVDALQIEKQKDLCTLVTCTPYGVNTHRLLVKAHRIETAEETPTIRVTADAMQIEPVIVAPIVAMPILLVLMLILILKPTKKRNEV